MSNTSDSRQNSLYLGSKNIRACRRITRVPLLFTLDDPPFPRYPGSKLPRAAIPRKRGTTVTHMTRLEPFSLCVLSMCVSELVRINLVAVMHAKNDIEYSLPPLPRTIYTSDSMHFFQYLGSQQPRAARRIAPVTVLSTSEYPRFPQYLGSKLPCTADPRY